MEDVRKLIVEVLEKGYLMSLATTDEGGPWVADVIFVYDDDLTIWWLSRPQTRHSKAIAHERRVAATITVSNRRGEDNVGLQICGMAEAVARADDEIVKSVFVIEFDFASFADNFIFRNLINSNGFLRFRRSGNPVLNLTAGA